MLRKILAPTDFSELSKRGVRYALEMARDTGAEVIVYYAIDVSSDWHDKPAIALAYQNTRQQLDRFLEDNFADCINLVAVRHVAEFGAPEKNIVEFAKGEGVDMIVMSTHGRIGFNHMILGSITEKVVARALCPMLVVPPREYKEIARAA
jgi:nucleotide-binding universal stress UspA family protein